MIVKRLIFAAAMATGANLGWAAGDQPALTGAMDAARGLAAGVTRAASFEKDAATTAAIQQIPADQAQKIAGLAEKVSAAGGVELAVKGPDSVWHVILPWGGGVGASVEATNGPVGATRAYGVFVVSPEGALSNTELEPAPFWQPQPVSVDNGKMQEFIQKEVAFWLNYSFDLKDVVRL